jgi:hypothetical protein
MSFDFNNDTEIYYYDEFEELELYKGYVSPADEWQVNRETLFREFNGSFFQGNDPKTYRLAKINNMLAFAESKDTSIFSKKARIFDQYQFLNQYIPEHLYTKITEILAFTQRDRRNIARDLGLNLDTLSNILCLWQLELFSTGNYISESVLDEINIFLKETSKFGELKKRGHITSKDIDRAESRILRQMYSQESESESQNKMPTRVLAYYQEFMQNMDQYLNKRQKKMAEINPQLPFHVYLLIQKIAILKKILPKIAMDYFQLYIEHKDLVKLGKILDTFYEQRPGMVGELLAQGIVLLEQYYQKEASLESVPTKVLTRVRKYRLEFGPEFKEIFNNMNQEQTYKVENITENESELVTDIKEQITALTDFSTPALQIDYTLLDKEPVLESNEYDQAREEEFEFCSVSTFKKIIRPSKTLIYNDKKFY